VTLRVDRARFTILHGGGVHAARHRLLYLVLASSAACAPDSLDTSDGAAPAAITDTTVDSAGASIAVADTTRAGVWAVSVHGVGPLRIGMPIPDLMPHLAENTDTTGVGGGCRFVFVADAPDSIGFMVESGRLARIDVRGGPTPTIDGARIGDTERRIDELYPGLRRVPHKYTDGNYLIVIPVATDTLHRYVFETDGERVTRYRAGLYPQVEWVEGCA